MSFMPSSSSGLMDMRSPVKAMMSGFRAFIFSTAFCSLPSLPSNDLAWISEICTILKPSKASGSVSQAISTSLILNMFLSTNAPYAIAAGGMMRLRHPHRNAFPKGIPAVNFSRRLTRTSAAVNSRRHISSIDSVAKVSGFMFFICCGSPQI